jgi:hypothetical protein
VITPAGSAPSVDLKVNGSDTYVLIPYNSNANVTWTSTNATSCNVSPTGWGGLASPVGGRNEILTTDKTYTIVCKKTGFPDAIDTVFVDVGSAGAPLRPTVSLTYDGAPDSIGYNGRTVVRWTSTNATGCTTNGGPWGTDNSRPTSGFENTPNLTANPTTYGMRCTGPGGSTLAVLRIPVGNATECSDGVDNDGDGRIDITDRACTGPSDDSEGFCGDNICEQASTREFNQGETPFTCPLDCIQPDIEEQ